MPSIEAEEEDILHPQLHIPRSPVSHSPTAPRLHTALAHPPAARPPPPSRPIPSVTARPAPPARPPPPDPTHHDQPPVPRSPIALRQSHDLPLINPNISSGLHHPNEGHSRAAHAPLNHHESSSNTSERGSLLLSSSGLTSGVTSEQLFTDELKQDLTEQLARQERIFTDHLDRILNELRGAREELRDDREELKEVKDEVQEVKEQLKATTEELAEAREELKKLRKEFQTSRQWRWLPFLG